jgi:hypothetical protein
MNKALKNIFGWSLVDSNARLNCPFCTFHLHACLSFKSLGFEPDLKWRYLSPHPLSFLEAHFSATLNFFGEVGWFWWKNA